MAINIEHEEERIKAALDAHAHLNDDYACYSCCSSTIIWICKPCNVVVLIQARPENLKVVHE